MFCRDAVLVKNEGTVLTAWPLYCRSWFCPVCGPKRLYRLRQDLLSGDPNTFITLTANPKIGTSPDDRAKRLKDAWVKIVRRAKKRYGYDELPYACVFEATKQGEPHLHILCRVPWLHQKWLSAQMDELTSSPIVDIRRIKSTRQAAYYLTKYVGKDPHRFGGVKRYWFTRDYRPDLEKTPLVERSSNAEWYRCSLNFEDWCSLQRYSGRVVRIDNEEATAVLKPPDHRFKRE